MNPKSKIVLKELQRIASRNGGILQPEIVVEEAKNPKSVLHSQFEWDDVKASHEYRIWQARMLIRVAVQIIPNGNEQPQRVFVSLKTDRYKDGGGYRAMVDVLSDSEMREQLLQQALDDMEYFRQKYAQLTELTQIFSDMEKVRVKYKRVPVKTQAA